MDYSRIYSIISYINLLINNKKKIEGCSILAKEYHQDEKDTSVNEEIESQEVNAEESTETNQDDNVVDINLRLEEEKMKEKSAQEKDKYQRLQAEYSNYIEELIKKKKQLEYLQMKK